jgi:lipopolysaccharide biosynthesis regulator YciM
MENRKKKQSMPQSNDFETLEVAPEKKESKLTLEDLVGVEEETISNTNEEENYTCGNCGAEIEKNSLKCSNCNQELVW